MKEKTNQIPTKCPTCGSNIKHTNNSLHCWDIEFECGFKIWGAIDSDTHGKNYNIETDCPKRNI